MPITRTIPMVPRLEPVAWTTDIAEGLAARVNDPMWMLARQWQLRELEYEDAGTPIDVRVRGDQREVSHLHEGRAWAPYEGDRPLEAAVEDEGPNPDDLRARARAGLALVRAIRRQAGDKQGAQARQALVDAFPLPEVEGGGRWLDAAPDGQAIAKAIVNREALPVAGLSTQQLAALSRAWLERHPELARKPKPPSSWKPARMEYDLRVATGQGGPVLRAPAHRGGNLDWYSFDLDQLDARVSGGRAVPYEHQAVPAPVRYSGMPDPRWWAFEDERVDFGDIHTRSEDLARMLMVEFATVYGCDWFILPLPAKLGSLTTIHELEVVDTFGVQTSIQPAGAEDDRWTLYTHTGLASGLFLPPSAPLLEGRPLEQVSLIRDELVNAGFGVEHRVEGPLGLPVDRRLDSPPPDPSRDHAARRSSGADFEFVLASELPEYWVPLWPTPVANVPGDFRFEVRPARRRVGDEVVELPPRGRVLAEAANVSLESEEVGRDGVQIERLARVARWTGGRYASWMGRRKRPGRGEGSSGLVFDQVRYGGLAKPDR